MNLAVVDIITLPKQFGKQIGRGSESEQQTQKTEISHFFEGEFPKQAKVILQVQNKEASVLGNTG